MNERYKLPKSKIPWTDYIWNPVIGCLHNCRYCYAKRLAKRFAENWSKKEFQYRCKKNFKEMFNIIPFLSDVDINPHLVKFMISNFQPIILWHRLNYLILPYEYSAIFCNSLSDIVFWPESIMPIVFSIISQYPQHCFLFLSKRRTAYLNWKYYANTALGFTVTNNSELEALSSIKKSFKTFLSIEPIHSAIDVTLLDNYNWIIVGPENSNDKNKIVPKIKWFNDIKDYCIRKNKPLFEKPEVSKLVERSLIQEYPIWHPKYYNNKQ